MKSVYKAIGILALAVLVAVGSAAKAEALVISVDPSTQDVNIGDAVSVNLLASDITDPIGGFYFSIEFDDLILRGDDYINDPDEKMGPAGDDFSLGFSGGTGSPLDLFYVADPSFDEADLAAAQGASFVLATLRFTAIANGLSPVFIVKAFDISNWDGTETIAALAQSGEVCVGRQAVPRVAVVVPDPCAVPEPGTFAMFGAGLAALGAVVVRRRFAARNA